MDAELFIPSAKRNNYSQARAVCEPCPVRGPCLEYATANQITLGLWGGHSPRERRPLTPSAGVGKLE